MAKKVASKTAKKVTTRRKRAPKKEEAKEKILKESELRQIEVTVLEMQNAKLVMGSEEQILRNYHLEFEILKNRIEKQRELVAEKDSKYNAMSKKYETLIKNICEKYEVNKVKFGYNPETGEIIE